MTLNGKSMSCCYLLVIRLLSLYLIVSNSVIKGSPSEGQFINADKDYYNIMSNWSVLYNGTMLHVIPFPLSSQDESTAYPKPLKLYHIGDSFLILRDNTIVYAKKQQLIFTLSCPGMVLTIPPFTGATVSHLINHKSENDTTLHYFASVLNFVELFTYKLSKCNPESPIYNYLNERTDKMYLKHYPVTFIGSFRFNNYTYTFNFRQVKGFEIIVGRVCNLLDYQTFDLSYTSLSAYCRIKISRSPNASAHAFFSKLKSTVYIVYIYTQKMYVCALNLTEIDIKLDQVRYDCSQGDSTIYTGVATSQIPNHCLPSTTVFLCDSIFSGPNGAMYSNGINVTGKIIGKHTLLVSQVHKVHFFEREFPNLPAILIEMKISNLYAFMIVDLYYTSNTSPSFSGKRFIISGKFEGLDPVSAMAYYQANNGVILSIPLFTCENYEITTCLAYFSECKVCEEGCLPIAAPCNPVSTFENAVVPTNQSYGFSKGSLVSFRSVNKLIHVIEAYQITFTSSDFTINCINPRTRRNLIECQTDSSESFIPFNTSFNVNAILTFQNTSTPLTLIGQDIICIVDPQISAIIPNYTFPSHAFNFKIQFFQFARSLSNQLQIFLHESACKSSYDNNIDGYGVNCAYFGSHDASPSLSLVGRVRNATIMTFNFTILPRPDLIRPLIRSLFPTAKLLFPIIINNIKSLFEPEMAFRLNSEVSEFKNCNITDSRKLVCDLPSLRTFGEKSILEVVLKSHGSVFNVSTPITVKMKKPPKIKRAEFDLDRSILSLEMSYYYSYFISFTKIQIIALDSKKEFNCSEIVFSKHFLKCKFADANITGSDLDVVLTVANYKRIISYVPFSESFAKINMIYLLVLAIIIAVTVYTNYIYRRDFMKKYKKKVRKKIILQMK